jgi:hypothetical protein
MLNRARSRRFGRHSKLGFRRGTDKLSDAVGAIYEIVKKSKAD